MTRPSFLSELKRRNVFKASAAYLALGWVVTQITATVAPVLHLPEWVSLLVLWIGVIGFPFVLMFSWIYELTPEGLKRESEVDRDASITHVTGRRLDYTVVGLLALAVALFALDRFVVAPRREAAREAATPADRPAADSASKAEAAPADAVPEIDKDPSIAVLPMVNMSEDKANEFFSDGISEELLNLLAKVPKLRVIARTSSFSFKGKDTPIPDIAKVLHVASVLEGSVRKSGDKVRITAQLIRSSDGSHLWSETYDRTLDDIFKVQDEIAAAVVAQLKIKLLGAAPTAKPVDPKVYPLILQAQALINQQSKASRQEAVAVLEQALAVAPNEARVWSGLARAYVNQALLGEGQLAERARLSREAANKALAIDPDNAIALGALGRIASDFDFDMPAGARYLQRAVELEPESVSVLNAAAVQLLNVGRFDESVRLARYCVAHDPANAGAYNNLAVVLYARREWDATIDAYRTALRLSPQYAGAHQGASAALLLGKQDPAGALKECEAEPDEASRMQCLAPALHALGRAKEADAATQTLIDKYGAEQAQMVASVYAYRGNADSSFAWLDKAAAAHDPALAQMLSEHLFDSLHDDSRWSTFLRKVGYAPEQLAKIELKVTLPQ